MALESEIARYTELLPELLPSYEGKYAVIRGRELVGVFASNEEAYTAGLDRVGLAPFLLRRVLHVQPRAFLPTILMTQKHG